MLRGRRRPISAPRRPCGCTPGSCVPWSAGRSSPGCSASVGPLALASRCRDRISRDRRKCWKPARRTGSCSWPDHPWKGSRRLSPTIRRWFWRWRLCRRLPALPVVPRSCRPIRCWQRMPWPLRCWPVRVEPAGNRARGPVCRQRTRPSHPAGNYRTAREWWGISAVPACIRNGGCRFRRSRWPAPRPGLWADCRSVPQGR